MCDDADACDGYNDLDDQDADSIPDDCDTCPFDAENDADGDGVCESDEIVGCQDDTACDYNENATDAGDCTYVDGVCETCSDETDGTGTVVDNDADDDTVCDADEIVGCQDDTACDYNAVSYTHLTLPTIYSV